VTPLASPIVHAPRSELPVLLSVPHSGRDYPAWLIAMAAGGRPALESLEEAVADSLSGNSTRAGVEGAGTCRLHGGVTRIYENMRPEEAAQILDQLDDETLRVVFARMEPKQIGAIVAAMSRERAVAFTKTLAADGEVARTATR